MDAKKLIPEKQVCQRYGVCDATPRRWDNDPSLDFPPAVRIRNRKYRYVDELDAFDERQRAAAPLDKKLNGES